MKSCLPSPQFDGFGRRTPEGGRPPLQVLLVSSDLQWVDAVQGAALRIGGSSVVHTDAKSALARLATLPTHFSHLLVDRNHDGGLLRELAALAKEFISPVTALLLLGSSDARHSGLRVISQAQAESVAQALLNGETPHADSQSIAVAELKAAIAGAMIDTRYQPIIRLSDLRPVGFEALARLHHPQHGVLPPDSFVPQMEDAGLAEDLTDIVSVRALSDLCGPLLRDYGMWMSLNFPLEVLTHPQVFDRLEARRAAAGAEPEQIVIELTERHPVDDIPVLTRSLEQLRGKGYRVIIDDVGPAIPNLDALLKLPFAGLKLDKSIVHNAISNAEDEAFIGDTIARARALGWSVVAEGVETTENLRQMEKLGADHIQGFLAARPLPVAAVPVWWDAWQRQHSTRQ